MERHTEDRLLLVAMITCDLGVMLELTGGISATVSRSSPRAALVLSLSPRAY